jgi:hypothetical protein
MQPPFTLAVLKTGGGRFKVHVCGRADQNPLRLRYAAVEGQGRGFSLSDEAKAFAASLEADPARLGATYEAASRTGGTRVDDPFRRVWPSLTDEEQAALAAPAPRRGRSPEHLAAIREKAQEAIAAKAAETAQAKTEKQAALYRWIDEQDAIWRRRAELRQCTACRVWVRTAPDETVEQTGHRCHPWQVEYAQSRANGANAPVSMPTLRARRAAVRS